MTSSGEEPSRGRGIVLLAFFLAAAVAVLLLVGPTGRYEDSGGNSGSTSFLSEVRAGEEDAGVLLVLAFPAFVAALALVLVGTPVDRVTRWIAGVVLLAFCFVGALSVGVFYLPAALAMLLAAARGSERAADRGKAAAG